MNNFQPADTLDKAAILYIKYLVERQFGNTDQTELKNNPFENTGGEIVATGEEFDLQIKSYNWSNEKPGYLRFYFLGDLAVEFKWYKHCLRGLEVKYGGYDLEETLDLIEECLEHKLEKIWEV